eukprot:8810362-Pyramimonas_sp.AAC.1
MTRAAMSGGLARRAGEGRAAVDSWRHAAPTAGGHAAHAAGRAAELRRGGGGRERPRRRARAAGKRTVFVR